MTKQEMIQTIKEREAEFHDLHVYNARAYANNEDNVTAKEDAQYFFDKWVTIANLMDELEIEPDYSLRLEK